MALLETRLLRVGGFNAHVVTALADARRVGTLTVGPARSVDIKLGSGGGLGESVEPDVPDLPAKGTQRTIRVSDYYAWSIARHYRTAPSFQLFWSTKRRDLALAKVVTWVKDQLAP